MEGVRSLVSARAGLEPPDWVLEARLDERMRKLGLRSGEDYLRALQSREEMQALIELLRVGETSFFRHKAHVRAVEEVVLPALVAQRKNVSAWSAGCATGEEPYTLAMMLRKALPQGRGIKVLASDISRESLAQARRGLYPASAMGSVPRAYHGYLEQKASGHLELARSIRALVQFEVRNLSNPPYPKGFDLIFCRNVLIYFTPEARRQAVRRLVNALAPGGFLFLGYSESLREVEGLVNISSGETAVYQRQEGVSAVAVRTPAPRPAAARQASHRPASNGPASSRPVSVRPGTALPVRDKAPSTPPRPSLLRVTLEGDYSDAKRLSSELRAAISQGPLRLEVNLDGATYLGEEAATVLKRAMASARSAGIRSSLLATRSGAQRFVRRYALDAEGGADS